MTSAELKQKNPTLWEEVKETIKYRVFDRISDVNEYDYQDFLDGKSSISPFQSLKGQNRLLIKTSSNKDITMAISNIHNLQYT